MNFSKILKWLLGLLALGALLSSIIYYFLDRQQEPYQMDEDSRRNAPGNFVNLSHGITHYRLEGPEDGDLVVLIHGGMVSGMFAWEKNYSYLAEKGFRVLMYDLYGRGYSQRIKEDYTPALFFNQFEELLDSLQIQQSFSIAGLSLGSMVAIHYTQQNPQEVKKLMLLSPAARGKFKVQPVLRVPVLNKLLMTAYWYPRTVNKQMQEFYQPQHFSDYEEKLREMIRYKGYKSSNYSTWLHTLTYDMESAIKEIGNSGTPTSLVLGEHDPYVQPDEAITYKQLIPAIEVYTIPEAGHVVNFEKSDSVNQLMVQFFSGQE